jgi:hypothetical protein
VDGPVRRNADRLGLGVVALIADVKVVCVAVLVGDLGLPLRGGEERLVLDAQTGRREADRLSALSGRRRGDRQNEGRQQQYETHTRAEPTHHSLLA